MSGFSASFERRLLELEREARRRLNRAAALRKEARRPVGPVVVAMLPQVIVRKSVEAAPACRKTYWWEERD